LLVERSPFGVRLREFECALVSLASLALSACAAQQICAGRMEVAVMVEVEAVEDSQSGFGSSSSATAIARLSSTTGDPVCKLSVV
jgi:hypothetical protein